MIGFGAVTGLVSSALSSMFGAKEGKSDVASNNSDFLKTFEQQTQQKTSDLIKTMDKNGDSVLSADEIGLSQKEFASIDTNADGKLDANELNAAYIKKEITTATQDLIKTYDINGDGKLSETEMNISPEAFSAIDTASKGAVGIQELMAAHPMNSLMAKFSSTANSLTSAANNVQRLDLTA
ncbi:MAG: hypothetical protein H7843_08005 [Nitrospirota bacterium]